MLFRQIECRRAENTRFLQMTAPISKWFKPKRTIHRDKNHAYFKCPNCKQNLRMPKGKSTITCRSCGTSFRGKS